MQYLTMKTLGLKELKLTNCFTEDITQEILIAKGKTKTA